ncbi:MAG: glutathionylspermidine synthase family protein [Fimbriiglobus sp.]
MRRSVLDPRSDWQQKVEKLGLMFHTADGVPYWDEGACYDFSRHEIDTIERATYALHEMCMALVQHVIDERLFGLFLIPPEYERLIVRSWDADEPSVYGRFDLAFNGVDPPKLLEYNADTPTALVEAAVAQWHWLKDTEPNGDQFNSIHERLIEAWKAVQAHDPGPVHFAAVKGNAEDFITAEYLRDTAIQAGTETSYLDVEDIGWDANRRRFVDLTGQSIHRIFKLYPWEWVVKEAFGQNVLVSPTSWVEPAWKMILSSKSILPLLHELNPGSPFLLPAWFEEPASGDYVRKPIHAREGANIRVVRGGEIVLETDGPYDSDHAVVYQQLAPIKPFDGRYPIVGSWVVNGWACGIGIREDDAIVTRNTSRFVPHRLS